MRGSQFSFASLWLAWPLGPQVGILIATPACALVRNDREVWKLGAGGGSAVWWGGVPPAGYFLVGYKKVTKEIGIGRTRIGIYTLQTEYFPQYKKHLLLWSALQFCIGDFSLQRSPATAEILCVFQGGRGLLRRKRYMQNRVNPYVGPPNGRFGQMRPLMYPPPLICECGKGLWVLIVESEDSVPS